MTAIRTRDASHSESRFMRAWIDVLARLWQSLERDGVSEPGALQILRLELHMLHTTARRLRQRGKLARAHEFSVRILVDDVLTLTADAEASREWRVRAQNRLFDEILAHVPEPLSLRRTA